MILKDNINNLEIDQILIQAQQGESNAIAILITNYEGLIRCVARSYFGFATPSFGIEDILSEARIGFIKAIDKYDSTRGKSLGSYAPNYIRNAIAKAVNDQSNGMGFPYQYYKTLRKIQDYENEYKDMNGKLPSVDEIAQYIGVQPETVFNIRKLENKYVSLDATIDEDATEDLYNVVPNKDIDVEKQYLLKESLDFIKGMILEKKLKTREVEILIKHFLDNRSLTSIGGDYGLTRERIRVIRNRAVEKIKKHPKYLAYK